MTDKYIRYPNGFVIWPQGLNVTHADVRHMLARQTNSQPLSAGFMLMHKGKPHCFGRSETLDLDSHETDSDVLAAQWGTA